MVTPLDDVRWYNIYSKTGENTPAVPVKQREPAVASPGYKIAQKNSDCCAGNATLLLKFQLIAARRQYNKTRQE
jgi:hypothetical protein